MRSLFQNILPEDVAEPNIRSAVAALWEEGDPTAIGVVVRTLLAHTDVLGRCAVFDLYSYQCTTYGEWMSSAFAGLLPSLLTMARDLLQRVWSGDDTFAPERLRSRVVASAMHVIWRAVEMEDAPLVLRSLAAERDPLVVFPTVWAANLMRGNDPTFDRRSAPLLAAVAQREDLPARIRLDAIDALGEGLDRDAADILEEMLRRLPLPLSAACAAALLDADDRYLGVVRELAQSWPPCDDYPVPDVLERIRR